MGQFFPFHDLVKGGKIKSYGPARRFSFTCEGKACSALGGFIGAPIAAIIVENALVSGGKHFKAFGTAGWIGLHPTEIGALHFPAKGWDKTGMITDYGCSDRETTFVYDNRRPTCDFVVSVNSFYRLTPDHLESYQNREFNLIDMEAAPLNHILTDRGASYKPHFVISDRIDEDHKWFDGSGSNALKEGVETGLLQLLQ
jgi:uridine phosphorylase